MQSSAAHSPRSHPTGRVLTGLRPVLAAAVLALLPAAPAAAYDDLVVEEKALRVLDTMLPSGVETREQGIQESDVPGWVKVSYKAKSRKGWVNVDIFVHEGGDYALAGRMYPQASGAEPRQRARDAMDQRLPEKFRAELVRERAAPMEGLREFLFEVRSARRGPHPVAVYVGEEFAHVGRLFGPANQNLTQETQRSWRGERVAWKDLTAGLEPVYGRAGAPVRFAMFTDPDCPACQRAKGRIDELMAEHGGELAGYLLWLPLDMHQHARPKAKVLACAPSERQDGLFDALKGTKPNKVGEVYEILERKDLEVPPQVRDCVASGQADKHLERFRSQADRVLLRSVPTVYFDGKVYNGFPEAAIKEALGNGSG